MTLYDWLLKNGAPVDYWKNVISGVCDAWCPFDLEDAERYSTEGLIDNPPEKEQWVNGMVIPFGVLLALKNVPLPDEMIELDFSDRIEEIRGWR